MLNFCRIVTQWNCLCR